jgi:high-affinity iron transporter
VVPAFLIMLREGLEAALIVGIVAAYLVKSGRRDGLPAVAIGVAAAVALSVGVAVIANATIGELPFVVQELIGGIATLIAVAVLTWMLFWMRRQGRHLKGELERGVDHALVGGSILALAGLAFVAVAREGLETVLFLSVVFSASAPGPEPAIGALLGLAVAVGIGVAIFWGGVRVDLRRFFLVTAVVLMFVAAGLCAYAVHEFGEAGVIANSGRVFDLSGVLPESSPLGALLAGLFGYRPSPTPLEVAAYFAYLVPVIAIYVWTDRPRQATRPVTA